MTVFICESYQREMLLHELAKTQENGVVMGVSTKTLSQALLKEEPQDTLCEQLRLMQKLLPAADRYRNYGAMFSYPAFIQEILSFAKKCALYGIAPDGLPSLRENEQELKQILTAALEMPFAEKILHDRREELPDRAVTKDTVLLESFEKEPFMAQLKEDMIRRGAKTMKFEASPCRSMDLRHILSLPKEIEAAAQEICRNSRSCNIILCDPAAQMPHVETVFRRYGIPYSCIQYRRPSLIHAVFAQLVRFALEPSNENLRRCIAIGAFREECSAELAAYIERISDPDVLIPRPVAEEYRTIMSSVQSEKEDHAAWKDFRRLDTAAQAYFEAIAADLQILLHPESGGQCEAAGCFLAAYTVLQESPLLSYPEEYELALKLRSSLQKALPEVHTRTDAEFLIRCLESMEASYSRFITSRCVVTDLTHPVPKKDITYVLGADGTCYPGFSAGRGLFDEGYTGRIASYPSLALRYELYMDQIRWITESADTVVWSYSTGDASGRQKLASFEIEELAGKEKDHKWELTESSYRFRPVHSLTPETARELFTINGTKIPGSISSIESWFRCPYSYFISYGLKIRENSLPSADAALTGTVCHAVMEILVREFRKMYPAAMDEEHLRPLVHPWFEALRVTVPKEKELLEMSEERLIRSLVKTGRFFARCEADTPVFEPVLTEEVFRNVTFADNVILRGTIDRIDRSLDRSMYRIIDYKSSSHDLNEKDVRAGLKLQLLTYMLAAMESPEILEIIPDAVPSGAYYYMIREETVSGAKETAAVRNDRRSHTGQAVEWKYRKYTGDPDALYVEKNRFMDAHTVGGWTFAGDFDTVDPGKHCKNRKAVYSPDAVRECLEDLYGYFHDTLLSEDGIALEPVRTGIDGPCTFCDYRAICRWHGDFKEAEPHTDAELKEMMV